MKIMVTFIQLVEYFLKNNECVAFIAATYPRLDFAAGLLLHKINKYDRLSHARGVAEYIHLFMASYGHERDLPEEAVTIARKYRLKRKKDWSVGYPLLDGTYFWFGTAGAASVVTPMESLQAILDAFAKFDWYYTMSDDRRVREKGDKAYAQLIKMCKAAGLSEDEAQKLQKDYWIRRGFKPPFHCLEKIVY